MRTLTGELWAPTTKGDPDARAMYFRHYSSQKRPAHADPVQFVGPGECLVLIRNDAVFVWRLAIDDCPLGDGVNCAIFRNEGAVLSSDLIREADEHADRRWPSERRHYTYINPKKIRSTNPGFCFLAAGWARCGQTAKGLLVLERITR